MDKDTLIRRFKADFLSQMLAGENAHIIIYPSPDLPDDWDWMDNPEAVSIPGAVHMAYFVDSEEWREIV